MYASRQPLQGSLAPLKETQLRDLRFSHEAVLQEFSPLDLHPNCSLCRTTSFHSSLSLNSSFPIQTADLLGTPSPHLPEPRICAASYHGTNLTHSIGFPKYPALLFCVLLQPGALLGSQC